jgi:choline dehydrogenase
MPRSTQESNVANSRPNNTQPSIDDLTTNQTFIAEQLALYQHSREGAYTVVKNGGNTVGFVTLPQLVSSTGLSQVLNSTSSPTDTKVPSSVQSLYPRQRALQLRQLAITNTAVQETAFKKGFLPITMLHPLLRGCISLNSTAPLSAPLVDYNTLSHPFNSEVFVQMLRFNHRLLTMPCLAVLQPMELVPGANVTMDQGLKSVLSGLVQLTYQHPCCTALEGRKEQGGVVDPKSLLVWGLRRLTIVDRSLMPIIVGAHLMGTVCGVAIKVC